MCQAGIIETDNSYQEEVVSKGYKFMDFYLMSKNVEIEITDFILSKRKWDNTKISRFEKPVFPYTIKRMEKWFNPTILQINEEEAFNLNIQFLESDLLAAAGTTKCEDKKIQAFQSYNNNQILLEKFKTGDHKFIQDEFGYRFHTSLTRLRREFRALLTSNGHEMVQIDLCNSQLFLAIYLLDWRNYSKGRKDNKNSFRNEI